LTFADAAKSYLTWAKGAKRTWADDEGRYKIHLEGRLGPLQLSEISTSTLIGLKAELDAYVSRRTGRTLAPATILQCLALVRQIFNYASETPADPTAPSARPMFEGTNPAKLTRRKGYGVRMPVIDNARLRVLTPDEVHKLLAAALPNHPDHHDMILVAYDCGLRLGELRQLTAQHIMGKG